MWAKERTQFNSGDEKIDKDRILCLIPKETAGPFLTHQRLIHSDDYFENEDDAQIDDGPPVSGFVSMVTAGKYIVSARKASGTSEMALYTTSDGVAWHRALFGQKKLESNGFTVMESTNYSVRVDVMEGEFMRDLLAPMGTLYSSNSNGTYFTKIQDHTNRNGLGFVDFERLDNIQGVALANIVNNAKEVLETGEPKQIQTHITFDDGRTFTPLKGRKDKDDGDLHLHGYSEMHNQGKVYSNKGAPGVLMGIGNIGDELHDYSESNLWISADGGESWYFGYEGPHKYEFADSGSILAAVSDVGATDHIKYSLNYGKDWKKLSVVEDEDETFKPEFFTTVLDSTSSKVVLTAKMGRGSQARTRIYSIDFKTLELEECKKGDFEDWHARQSDEDKEPGCVMGHTQSFRRKKPEAECSVNNEFKEPDPESTNCDCAKEDFECDAGFVRSKDRKSCEPEGRLTVPKGECKDDDDTFKGPSGFRLIPGNTCKENKVYEDMMEDVDRSCKQKSHGATGEGIQKNVKVWDVPAFREYRYLERTSLDDDNRREETDETVLLITEGRTREVWKTRDHGKTWDPLRDVEDPKAIYPNVYQHSDAYILTSDKQVWYTDDRAETFNSFESPTVPNDRGLPVIRFHPEHPKWLIWTGCRNDDSFERCDPIAHVTTHRSNEWHNLIDHAGSCEFVWREERHTSPEKLVYCIEEHGHEKRLLASEDFFETEDTIFKDIVNFATMSEFIIVAMRDGSEQSSLALNASVDAENFAPARFPPKMSVTPIDGHDGYTVLDSSSHSIFLHATVNSRLEREYGTLAKSNSNGTNFATALYNVNRNPEGFVDFEKLQALEGAALANVVANREDVEKGQTKKIKTKITHNDGADWDYIRAPTHDVDGKEYKDCPSDRQSSECSLHLHGYTERRSPDDTYSSPSAVGLVLGIGNVGEYLNPKHEGDTFVSRDGGITWHAAMKGQYMWEFGDQGSIIVLVEENAPTSKLYYSLDEGRTFDTFDVSGPEGEEYEFMDLSTIPSDGSLNFLLWGREPSGRQRRVTINVDFSGAFSRKCVFHEDDPEANDFYLWEPEHPNIESGCLFGHHAKYHRKKDTSTDCFIGVSSMERQHPKYENCECTHRDFECDWNYERQESTGLCIQVGPQRDPIEDCNDESRPEAYFPVTGYRRIPGDTCQGGVEQSKMGSPKKCPGMDEEFYKKYGTSGWLIFFIVVICVGAAGGIGWFIYTRFLAGGQIGRIHLGDSDGIASTTSRMHFPMPNFDTNSPFVRYPVVAVSAVAAGLMAVPMIIISGGKWIRDRFAGSRRGGYSRLGGAANGWSGGSGSRTYTSRRSFARGRDWAGGANAESDLLGEDSDEEA